MRVLAFLAILLSACQTANKPQSIETLFPTFNKYDEHEGQFDSLPAGTIIQQRAQDIGHGFFKVSRSQINSMDHWEGISHFTFIFFNELKVCQCTPYNTAKSEDGRYLAYVSQKNNGGVELFDAKPQQRKTLTTAYTGYPENITIQKNEMVIELKGPEGKRFEPLRISLTD